MDKPKINRKYKDRLFRLVFREKADLLELYNALNGSHYQNADDLEITTLEDVVYMGMKNDISFLIGDILNLYEHQSTYNPNMPVRGFLYLADLYRKHIESRKLDLYSSSLQKLPLPRYLVFYNGTKQEADRLELLLSDSFQNQGQLESCLELKTVMLNINLENNRELMERCRQLKEYAQFVSAVRERIAAGLPWGEAVDDAVDWCIRNGILADILAENRAEVRDMILTEYDEQRHVANERAEAKEEGRREGIKEGIEKGIKEGIEKGMEEGIEKGMKKGICALIKACMELNVPEAKARGIVNEKFSLTDEETDIYMDEYWK